MATSKCMILYFPKVTFLDGLGIKKKKKQKSSLSPLTVEKAGGKSLAFQEM